MRTTTRGISWVAYVLAIAPLATIAAPMETTGTPVEDTVTGHWYEFVPVDDITWDDANDAANDLLFGGRVGHLATITSLPEDDFIELERQKTPLKEVWVGGFQDPDAICGMTPAKQCGWTWVNGDGTFPGDNSGPEYANWNLANGEPNDNYGANSEQHLTVGLQDARKWNDEGTTPTTGVGNITGYIVEYDSQTEAFVEIGENQLVFASANVPGSDNPLTMAYGEITEGGAVSISCCRIEDEREIAGASRRWWQPWWGSHPGRGKLDIAAAVADVGTNPSCLDTLVVDGIPLIAPGTAILKKWQRGVPASRGIPDPLSTIVAREHDIGVCFIQADPVARGIVFSAEESANVLGYSVDCSEEDVKYRPFTAGVTTSAGERDVDFPNIVPWTSDCDGSRSAKRHSDNVMLLNLRHDTRWNPSWLYLAGLDWRLQQSIRNVRSEGCVANHENFLDDLLRLVRRAQRDILRNRGEAAVEKLDDATLLALLSPASAAASMLSSDPYGSCPGNAEALFVGRLMALKFATCSELVQSDSGENAKAPAACAIDTAVFAEMPPLPGFP